MLKCFNQASNLLLSDIKDNRDNNNNKDNKQISNISIPLDPQEFYNDFGYLLHPKTGEFVTELTDYQYKIWKNANNSKYRISGSNQKSESWYIHKCIIRRFSEKYYNMQR